MLPKSIEVLCTSIETKLHGRIRNHHDVENLLSKGVFVHETRQQFREAVIETCLSDFQKMKNKYEKNHDINNNLLEEEEEENDDERCHDRSLPCGFQAEEICHGLLLYLSKYAARRAEALAKRIVSACAYDHNVLSESMNHNADSGFDNFFQGPIEKWQVFHETLCAFLVQNTLFQIIAESVLETSMPKVKERQKSMTRLSENQMFAFSHSFVTQLFNAQKQIEREQHVYFQSVLLYWLESFAEWTFLFFGTETTTTTNNPATTLLLWSISPSTKTWVHQHRLFANQLGQYILTDLDIPNTIFDIVEDMSVSRMAHHHRSSVLALEYFWSHYCFLYAQNCCNSENDIVSFIIHAQHCEWPDGTQILQAAILDELPDPSIAGSQITRWDHILTSAITQYGEATWPNFWRVLKQYLLKSLLHTCSICDPLGINSQLNHTNNNYVIQQQEKTMAVEKWFRRFHTFAKSYHPDFLQQILHYIHTQILVPYVMNTISSSLHGPAVQHMFPTLMRIITMLEWKINWILGVSAPIFLFETEMFKRLCEDCPTLVSIFDECATPSVFALSDLMSTFRLEETICVLDRFRRHMFYLCIHAHGFQQVSTLLSQIPLVNMFRRPRATTTTELQSRLGRPSIYAFFVELKRQLNHAMDLNSQKRLLLFQCQTQSLSYYMPIVFLPSSCSTINQPYLTKNIPEYVSNVIPFHLLQTHQALCTEQNHSIEWNYWESSVICAYNKQPCRMSVSQAAILKTLVETKQQTKQQLMNLLCIQNVEFLDWLLLPLLYQNIIDIPMATTTNHNKNEYEMSSSSSSSTTSTDMVVVLVVCPPYSLKQPQQEKSLESETNVEHNYSSISSSITSTTTGNRREETILCLLPPPLPHHVHMHMVQTLTSSSDSHSNSNSVNTFNRTATMSNTNHSHSYQTPSNTNEHHLVSSPSPTTKENIPQKRIQEWLDAFLVRTVKQQRRISVRDMICKIQQTEIDQQHQQPIAVDTIVHRITCLENSGYFFKEPTSSTSLCDAPISSVIGCSTMTTTTTPTTVSDQQQDNTSHVLDQILVYFL